MRNALVPLLALLGLGCSSLIDGISKSSGDDDPGSVTHPPTPGPNSLSQQEIDALLSAHNAARASPLNPAPSPPLPQVSWDPTLAQSAYNYLVECIPNGSLVAHNMNRSSDYQALGGSGYVGENIYATTAKQVSAADALNSWMSEAALYDYAANNIDSTTGHYTQVVWRDSVRIGCAVVFCSSIQYPNTLLCDYAPGGNNLDQRPY